MLQALHWAWPLGSATAPSRYKPFSLDELLQQVKQGRVNDAEENRKRIAEFQRDRARQQKLLADMRADQRRQEQRSNRLEDTFEANDIEIIDLEHALLERLGDLKELFRCTATGRR